MNLHDKVRMLDDVFNWFHIEEFNMSIRPTTTEAIRALLHELQTEIINDVTDIVDDYIVGTTSVLLKLNDDAHCPEWNIETRNHLKSMMKD